MKEEGLAALMVERETAVGASPSTVPTTKGVPVKSVKAGVVMAVAVKVTVLTAVSTVKSETGSHNPAPV
ncbi:MAG: hypothetical protein IPK53_08430 [bacterium]|nr:hypothetical protein [bacterium]